MRLAGKDEDDGAVLLPQQALQAVHVRKEQIGALVGRKAARKADDQRGWRQALRHLPL